MEGCDVQDVFGCLWSKYFETCWNGRVWFELRSSSARNVGSWCGEELGSLSAHRERPDGWRCGDGSAGVSPVTLLTLAAPKEEEEHDGKAPRRSVGRPHLLLQIRETNWIGEREPTDLQQEPLRGSSLRTCKSVFHNVLHVFHHRHSWRNMTYLQKNASKRKNPANVLTWNVKNTRFSVSSPKDRHKLNIYSKMGAFPA